MITLDSKRGLLLKEHGQLAICDHPCHQKFYIQAHPLFRLLYHFELFWSHLFFYSFWSHLYQFVDEFAKKKHPQFWHAKDQWCGHSKHSKDWNEKGFCSVWPKHFNKFPKEAPKITSLGIFLKISKVKLVKKTAIFASILNGLKTSQPISYFTLKLEFFRVFSNFCFFAIFGLFWHGTVRICQFLTSLLNLTFCSKLPIPNSYTTKFEKIARRDRQQKKEWRSKKI